MTKDVNDFTNQKRQAGLPFLKHRQAGDPSRPSDNSFVWIR
jgi:hypothetical protein